jgi:hypothetical protein
MHSYQWVNFDIYILAANLFECRYLRIIDISYILIVAMNYLSLKLIAEQHQN